MVNVVARVPDPYARSNGRPPLSVGLFVDAEIQGQTLSNLVELPRSALRGQDQVLVVDEDTRLRFRQVDVLRRANDMVYITGGLAQGDQVCISALQSTVDGMLVRLMDEAPRAFASSPDTEPGS